jgi:outer membrane protein assembly factor BamE (lipoprotein component of BamABCDE complex)
MKKFLVILFLLTTILFGCSNDSSNSKNDTNELFEITKELVEENGKIGLTKDEVKDIFGEYSLAGEGEFEGNEVWLYDSVKDDFEYEKSLQSVAFDELRSENVKYQLYINFVDDKTMMYLYIYKGEDGQLRNFQVNPDGSTQEIKN